MPVRIPFKPDALAGERFFRWRGGNVSRLEGLADAVFALALTFLVIRLEVPSTYGEVQEALLQVPVYAACFALFLWIWYCHHQFHRRYGLEGPLTLAIDGAILLVVLLFVVPLRFLANYLYWAFADPSRARAMFSNERTEYWLEMRDLMGFYAGGFSLVFLLFALQTYTALSQRKRLELDALELRVTAGTIGAHLLSAAIGLAALGTCYWSQATAPFAGLVFFAMGPLHWLYGSWNGKRLVRLEASI